MEFLVQSLNHMQHISASIYSVVIMLSEIYAMTIGNVMPEIYVGKWILCVLDFKVISLTPVFLYWSR